MESKQNIPLAEQKREQMPKHNIKKLLTLFSTTLYISAFTFGGGFVIVTFMKRKFVDQLKWIDEKEMLDFTALAQSSPGAIAVNAAILVGWKVCGFAGMLTAILGTILPPMIILSGVRGDYQCICICVPSISDNGSDLPQLSGVYCQSCNGGCFKGNAGRSSCCYIGCSM